jgi:hypothetical protein
MKSLVRNVVKASIVPVPTSMWKNTHADSPTE